ncbi:fused MFS/spermidine synthase, partial [Desulfovibrio sp. OttesenSCG-928-A18]|nr:fused MFS/spermidine synthase [Desulfovibrio sp. OttesenSCG-928-A18]
PWLGSSIVVWTSLIGVILASLSVGYWLGGRLADNFLKDAPRTAGAPDAAGAKDKSGKAGHDARSNLKACAVLSTVLLMASLTVFITALIGDMVPSFLMSLFSSLHLATVGAALALFAVPSVLCGIVSPYAMRLAITSKDRAGTVIGRLNAIATVGSIVGTFLGGFVLLSWFDTTSIFFGVAACLLLASALVQLRPLMPKASFALLLAGAMVANGLYSNWLVENAFAENKAIPIETSYSSIRVARGTLEGRPTRFLLTDPDSCQSGAFEDDHDALAFSYTKFYALGTAMNPGAKRILMLGGGGYSVPKWLLAGRSELERQEFQLDTVELDPGMTRAAAQYFWLPQDDKRMRIFHEDARAFVNRTSAAVPEGEYGPYQLIFADIFNSWYTVPFHVGTAEAAANIKRLLSRDGIYIMNIISAINGDNGRLLRSIRNAFAESFDEVHIFPVQQKYNGGVVQNVMLLAFRTPRALPDPEKEPVPPHIALMLGNRWTSPFPAPEDDVPALRDGYAPVERYTLGFVR